MTQARRLGLKPEVTGVISPKSFFQQQKNIGVALFDDLTHVSV